MNKTIIAAVAALIIIIGGVLLFGRRATAPDTSSPDAVGTTTGSTMTGTSTTQTPASGRPGTSVIPNEGEVTLALGEAASFRNLLIIPLSIVEDSRCPKDVQCIQAGTVRVKVEINMTNGTSTKTLSLGTPVTLDDRQITLTKVAPVKTTAGISPSEYRLTFKVSKPVANAPAGGCFVGGCSGEVCSDSQDVASACIYKPEFQCYKSATCERQSNGQCGWTQSAELLSCVANAQ